MQDTKLRKIYIYTNGTDMSIEARNKFINSLKNSNFDVLYNEKSRKELALDADLIACIGGDGTFLHFVHDCDFPSKPIIGINTGHLGFFQELNANNRDIERFSKAYFNNEYILQVIPVLETDIVFKNGKSERIYAINEMMVRGPLTNLTHFEVKINDTVIQNFSGDGILVSSEVGSTAYNYSLGGSIVAPGLGVLQLTPVAPASTNAYRSYHSSIILPIDGVIRLTTARRTADEPIYLTYDGFESIFDDVSYIEIKKSSRLINLIRFKEYDYWTKLRDKLI